MKFKLPAWFARPNPAEVLTVADATARAEQAKADLEGAKAASVELRARFLETRDAATLEEIEASEGVVRRLELLIEVVDNDLQKAEEAEAASKKASLEARLAQLNISIADQSKARELAKAEAEAFLEADRVREERRQNLIAEVRLKAEANTIRRALGLSEEIITEHHLMLNGLNVGSADVVEYLDQAKGTSRFLANLVNALQRGQL